MPLALDWSTRQIVGCATAIPTTTRPPSDGRTPTGARRSRLGHMRAHGVRRLLIYCCNGLYCGHSAPVDADRWPDDMAVRDLCPKAVCTRCGIIGVDVRPKWDDRPKRETMLAAQCRTATRRDGPFQNALGAEGT
jgi:hypothetical protein